MNPRVRIAFLSLRRHRPHLNKAEAEGAEFSNHVRFLSMPAATPSGLGKVRPNAATWRHGSLGPSTVRTSVRKPGMFPQADRARAASRMRSLRRNALQDQLEQDAVDHESAPLQARDDVPQIRRDSYDRTRAPHVLIDPGAKRRVRDRAMYSRATSADLHEPWPRFWQNSGEPRRRKLRLPPDRLPNFGKGLA